jgi:hypothetical protein
MPIINLIDNSAAIPSTNGRLLPLLSSSLLLL